MRIPSAKTDQQIFFVAVDSTDHSTRKTGLSAFTVYRSRNGAAAVVYTTPTIVELSAANMPGVYALLLDEDTTIASTSDSEEYCVHITCTNMAPVTRTIELYRRTATSGNAVLVDTNGRIDVIKVAGTTQTAGDLAALINVIDDYVDTEVAAIKAKTDNLPVDPASASTIATSFTGVNTKLDTIDDFVDTEVAAIKTKTDQLVFTVANQVDVNVIDWKGAVAPAMTGDAFARLGAPAGVSVSADIGTVAGYIDTEVAAIKLKTDLIPAAPAAVSDIPTANQNADALLDRTNGIETGYTLRQTIRLMSAVLAGKSTGHPGSPVYRNMTDTADRVTATVSSGNRSVVTLTP